MEQESLRPMKDAQFMARRAKARERSNHLQRDSEQRGEPLGWFEALYDVADGDEAQVPWADGHAHPGLSAWLEKPGLVHQGRAIDIGCGLGDNAEALAAAGYDVTAFDLSQTAVDWAKKRFADSPVRYQSADLFNLPDEWTGAFDLVHETYTLQAMKTPERARAFAPLARLVKPGGRLLVICRSKPEGTEPEGPPWPLARSEFAPFRRAGLIEDSLETFEVEKERVIAHMRAVFVRPVV